MASSISTTTLDENFPVAGQDNDSQGFRDNFSIIKDNFNYAKTEIEDLQTGVARIDASSDFDGNDIVDANLLAVTAEANTTGSTGLVSNSTIPFSSGHFYVITAQNDISLTFTNWPANGRYASIRVMLFGDGTARTITWASIGGVTPKKSGDFPSPFTVTSATNPVVVEAFTYNGGSTVYMKYLGQFS